MEGGDNWLLAKKPMYQCASCERVLTDLKQNPDDFIPWKKLQKDDNYRMGHGFSRMLQMVNTDILKVAEINRENKKGYISDEEKEKDGNKEKNNNVFFLAAVFLFLTIIRTVITLCIIHSVQDKGG